ncbi:MAG: hypothetical protein ILO53_05925 [Clostridia bacterium]|nr:hypothetical protein [Clostridia bacterium]
MFQGRTVVILTMVIENKFIQFDVSCKLCCDNTVYQIVFANVSRLKVKELSIPLAIEGLEIINHFQEGWENDSKYEVRDCENGCISFFCEHYLINKLIKT